MPQCIICKEIKEGRFRKVFAESGHLQRLGTFIGMVCDDCYLPDRDAEIIRIKLMSQTERKGLDKAKEE
jgi:hypothetical protein